MALIATQETDLAIEMEEVYTLRESSAGQIDRGNAKAIYDKLAPQLQHSKGLATEKGEFFM